MSDFMRLVFAAYIGSHLPQILIGSLALAGFGAYGLYNQFKTASKEISSGVTGLLEDMDRKRDLAQSIKLLVDGENVPEKFKEMHPATRASHLAHWLPYTSAKQNRLLLDMEPPSPHLSKVVDCLKIHTAAYADKGFGWDQGLAPSILRFLQDNKEEIAVADVREVADNVFENIGNSKATTVASLNTLTRMGGSYGGIVTPENRASCQEHLLSALQYAPARISSGYSSSFQSATTNYELHLKALDILLFSKHAHGGIKSGAHLSLELGDYTEEQRESVLQAGKKILHAVADKRKLNPYAYDGVSSSQETFLRELDERIGKIDSGYSPVFKGLKSRGHHIPSI